MADIRHIDPAHYNAKLAEAIKKSGDFTKPEWIVFVKTGASKTRPNIDLDFWFKRAASILRQLYTREVVGVGRLRTRYGGRKNRGSQPAKFVPAGGKIIRTILQQAESAGLIEKVNKKGQRAGRKLTVKGREFMEQIA
jgi:small subunit ribosomal protein S19e